MLRHANDKLQNLQFYSDRRTPEIAELTNQPTSTLVFWSNRLSWQLRVHVEMAIQTTGPQVDELWERLSQSAAAGDDLSIDAPGDALTGGPERLREVTGVHHLALLVAQVQAIDWLELRRDGHRRANFGENRWAWLAP